jgi:hypothetical protein
MPATAEREVLIRLCRENRRLRQERDMLSGGALVRAGEQANTSGFAVHERAAGRAGAAGALLPL